MLNVLDEYILHIIETKIVNKKSDYMFVFLTCNSVYLNYFKLLLPIIKMTEKKLNQIEQCNETANKNNNIEKELWEVLDQEHPEVVLSTSDENSPKIRTYHKNNSYFATKGTCRSDRSQMYSIQDLVTIDTSSYCSPDGRNYGSSINKINLFPSEDDLPEEYDNTTSNKYGSWQYDYLSYDKENKRIWRFSTGNNLAPQEHYFWVSPDSTILFPWVETVQECNGWYFHHIVLDNQSDYKYVDKKSIQETINALFDQKREKEKLEEYRKENGDIWLELPWTTYSSGYYQPRTYVWDKHWTPAHEYSNERWNTNKILVKFWEPWDYINFCRWLAWYTVYIDENKRIYLDIHTSCKRNNNQDWWYDELDNSIIQPWQIFINGKDVYEDTMEKINSIKEGRINSRKSRFDELRESLINTYSFTESEFKSICKYAWKGKILSLLSVIKSMMETWDIKKEEILSAMTDIKYPGDMVFRNYVLIKRKAKKFRHEDVKRVVDKWNARAYISDSLKWIQFVWNFDDALWALELALDQWLFRKNNFAYSTVLETTVSGLWQALIDAGVVAD